jgi:hypothetical protein
MKSPKYREQMFSLCQEWESGELNKTEFCIQHNIKVHRFNYWRKQYLQDQKEQQGNFVELTTELPVGIEIIYPNGVSLKASSNISHNELKALITLF